MPWLESRTGPFVQPGLSYRSPSGPADGP